MQTYLLIAGGGAIGSVARYWMAGAIDSQHRSGFPWGTVLVNILGSFAIGLAAGLALALAAERPAWSDGIRAFVMVGICGGFTTFSSFSLQTLALLRDGDLLRAGGHVLLSVLACLIATWAGLALAQAFGK